MKYEGFVGLENISVNNTTILPPLTSLPESYIVKHIENCTICFFDLRLLVYKMIMRLFRFQLLIFMVWMDCLISMFIRMEALLLGQQKLQVLQSCFVMES